MRNGLKQDVKKKRIWFGGGLLLLLALLTAGRLLHIGPWDTGHVTHPSVTDDRSEEETQTQFDALMQQIFVSEVTDDSITLNYTLKDPQKYGIDKDPETLGSYSIEAFRDDRIMQENWMASLESFDYDKLTKEQQLIYDILRSVINTNRKSADLAEYAECLGPTTGIQAQLPVLLAEYHFYRQENVDTYLHLLKKVPEYFEEIIAFEQKKSADGLFMNDTTAQAIIDQCQEFITSPEENYLISTFAARLDEVNGLSGEQKKRYIRLNKKYVTGSVIPAYQSLIDALLELKGSEKNQQGLCYLPKGKEYYAYLVESMTGSARSVSQIDQWLDETLQNAQKKMSQVLSEAPDAYYDAQNVKYPSTDPVETIRWLQEQITADFPELSDDIRCNVKYVDASLEDSLSPAFYLTSPMDAYQDNVVYINQKEEYDLSQAFPTVAHESYPGHLYQNAYFQEQDPAPIRSVISIGGYTEGWGTYAELYSYRLARLDQNEADLLSNNTLATLCLYAKADIAIHYKGWNLAKLTKYLKKYGFSGSQSRTMYDAMLAEPAGYLQYTVGYLEIQALKDTAQDRLGSAFSAKEFHKFFLSAGEAPFDVLQDRLQQWIREQM